MAEQSVATAALKDELEKVIQALVQTPQGVLHPKFFKPFKTAVDNISSEDLACNVFNAEEKTAAFKYLSRVKKQANMRKQAGEVQTKLSKVWKEASKDVAGQTTWFSLRGVVGFVVVAGAAVVVGAIMTGDPWTSLSHMRCQKGSNNTIAIDGQKDDGFGLKDHECKARCLNLRNCNMYTYGAWEKLHCETKNPNSCKWNKQRCQVYEKCERIEAINSSNTSLHEKNNLWFLLQAIGFPEKAKPKVKP